MKVRRFSFNPGQSPRLDTPEGRAIFEYVQRLERNILSGLEVPSYCNILVWLHEEPENPFAGMEVLADGVDWNPGSGAGKYVRNEANTAWVLVGPVSSGGMTLISSQSVSAVASVAFTGIDATYDEYEIHFQSVIPVTNSVSAYLRTSSNNGVSYDSAAGNYGYALNTTIYSAPAPSGLGATAATQIQISQTATTSNVASHGGISGKVVIINPANTTTNKLLSFETANGTGAANAAKSTGVGTRYATTAVNAVQFLFSAGNVASGLFKLYGIRRI